MYSISWLHMISWNSAVFVINPSTLQFSTNVEGDSCHLFISSIILRTVLYGCRVEDLALEWVFFWVWFGPCTLVNCLISNKPVYVIFPFPLWRWLYDFTMFFKLFRVFFFYAFITSLNLPRGSDSLKSL